MILIQNLKNKKNRHIVGIETDEAQKSKLLAMPHHSDDYDTSTVVVDVPRINENDRNPAPSRLDRRKIDTQFQILKEKLKLVQENKPQRQQNISISDDFFLSSEFILFLNFVRDLRAAFCANFPGSMLSLKLHWHCVST